MRKKILIASSTFPPERNGVAHVVEAHATGLARLGHDVTVVTGPNPQSREPSWDGVKIRRFAVQGNGQWILGGYSGDIRGYQEFIASFDGDLIICHCWQIWSTDLAVAVFDRVRCPKILVSHGVSASILRKSIKGVLIWLAWLPYLARMCRMVRKFDHVVVLSDLKNSKGFFDHQWMHRLCYDKHSVIPNGIDPKRFETAGDSAMEFRKRHGIGQRPMVLCVSNYGKGKNQKMAVQVFLEAKLPDAVLLLIGGELNEYAQDLQFFARQSGASGERVIFLEKQTMASISAAYCAADLFLFTSNLEVQPLVIFEAMAAGKPFVCTDVGCVRENPGGVVVKNHAEMVLQVRSLMADEGRRAELGRQGRLAINQRHTWDTILNHYNTLIGNICQNPSRK